MSVSLDLADVDDETRFLDIVRRAAARVGCGLWTWSTTQGLVRDGVGGQGQYLTEKMTKAVDAAISLDLPDVFVFLDVRRQLEDEAVVRRLKELAQRPPPAPTVILTTQDQPRGVLLAGVPGCGKSMIAKTVSSVWGVPLVLLDPGRLFGPYLGQSEGRLQDSLDSIEALAPVVLWIDEIEKGFASESVDGGAAERIKGTFLRWMQERSDGVFVIATCNQVDKRPPEFPRKGRFDEVFFVDLPGVADRRTIFSLHLTKRRRDPAGFDLDGFAAATEGFSGAEIEAVVVAGLYRAYADGTDLTTRHILDEIAQTRALSITRAEDVAALRRWAESRAVLA